MVIVRLFMPGLMKMKSVVRTEQFRTFVARCGSQISRSIGGHKNCNTQFALRAEQFAPHRQESMPGKLLDYVDR